MLQINTKKKLLTDVAVIRPILIVLLVFYHAFAPFSGAWGAFEGYQDIAAYYWLDKFSYSFMLEMFVLISGYVFGYQVSNGSEDKLNFRFLLLSKFRRLIVPCVFFSLVYSIVFIGIKDSVWYTCYDLFNGVGHMWFLPMLLWCFVGIWIIERLKIGVKGSIPFLFLLSFVTAIDLPLRINTSFYYMLFFYLGYITTRNNVSIKALRDKRYVPAFVVSFFILFPLLTVFRENAKELFGEMRIVAYILSHIAKLAYALLGIAMCVSCVNVVLRYTETIPVWLIRVGSLCMGIYLIQQFILKGLYYQTSLPVQTGSYWLPWIGFVITLFVSLLVSWLTYKTKLGRFLIGQF